MHSCRKQTLYFTPPAPSYPVSPLCLSVCVSVTLSLGRPPTLSPEECVEAVSAGLGCLCPWLKVSVGACFTQTSGNSFHCCSCGSLRLFQLDGDSLHSPFSPPAVWLPSRGLTALLTSPDGFCPNTPHPILPQQPLSFSSFSFHPSPAWPPVLGDCRGSLQRNIRPNLPLNHLKHH